MTTTHTHTHWVKTFWPTVRWLIGFGSVQVILGAAYLHVQIVLFCSLHYVFCTKLHSGLITEWQSLLLRIDDPTCSKLRSDSQLHKWGFSSFPSVCPAKWPNFTLNSATSSFSCGPWQIKIRNTMTVRFLTNYTPEKVWVNTVKIKFNETKPPSRPLSELRKFIDVHEKVGLCQKTAMFFKLVRGWWSL